MNGLEVVVILGSNVNAQIHRLRIGDDGYFRHVFRLVFAVHLDGVGQLPVARFQESRGRIVGRQKGDCEIAIGDARERLSTHPNIAPLFRSIELLVSEGSELAAFAIERCDRFDGNGVGDGEVAKTAAPGQAAVHARAIVGYRGFDAEDVGVIEVEFLGDFQVASLQEKVRSAGAVRELESPDNLYSPLLAAFSSCGSSMTIENGQPPVSTDAFGWTKSRIFWGLESSLYFLSCQLLTTAPRLENSTRYRSFSTTMVRSCASATGSAAGTALAETVGGAVTGAVSVVAGVPLVAGAVAAGWFGCGRCAGGFGPKYLDHRIMTAMESSAATRMRNSGVNLSFFGPIGVNWFPGGLLTGEPRVLQLSSWNSLASLPISPEPGRNQICGITDGSAAIASCRARRRATRQIVQSLRGHSGNRWARNGTCLQIARTGKLCRHRGQKVRHARRAIAVLASLHSPASSQALQEAKELRGQRRKRRFRNGTFRVNDDVPSCWYLLAVDAHDLSQPPAHAVANHGPAECLLDAETEAAQWQFIGADEHGEVGVGAALSGGVNGVKFTLAE